MRKVPSLVIVRGVPIAGSLSAKSGATLPVAGKVDQTRIPPRQIVALATSRVPSVHTPQGQRSVP